jgi:hypothetical protein
MKLEKKLDFKFSWLVSQKKRLVGLEVIVMWRSLFLALGVFMLIVGIQCLGVSQFILKIHGESTASASLLDVSPIVGPQLKFTPLPWTPWSLMATGIVVCIYSFTLPKRVSGN